MHADWPFLKHSTETPGCTWLARHRCIRLRGGISALCSFPCSPPWHRRTSNRSAGLTQAVPQHRSCPCRSAGLASAVRTNRAGPARHPARAGTFRSAAIRVVGLRIDALAAAENLPGRANHRTRTANAGLTRARRTCGCRRCHRRRRTNPWRHSTLRFVVRVDATPVAVHQRSRTRTLTLSRGAHRVRRTLVAAGAAIVHIRLEVHTIDPCVPGALMQITCARGRALALAAHRTRDARGALAGRRTPAAVRVVRLRVRARRAAKRGTGSAGLHARATATGFAGRTRVVAGSAVVRVGLQVEAAAATLRHQRRRRRCYSSARRCPSSYFTRPVPQVRTASCRNCRRYSRDPRTCHRRTSSLPNTWARSSSRRSSPATSLRRRNCRLSDRRLRTSWCCCCCIRYRATERRQRHTLPALGSQETSSWT